MSNAHWIAADWGTTNLRLWAMRGADVVHHRASGQGMGGLSPAEFAPVLAHETAEWRAGDWAKAPVVACGMVGSRQGWTDAPYATAPTQAGTPLTRVAGENVWIAGGVKQLDPADVMRGEETQIAGLLAARPDFDGVVCLPGTHTKWVRVSAAEICSFQSFMTGEIFALLAEQSILRHTVQATEFDAEAFDGAVQDALAQPHRAFGRLFQLRAGALVGDLTPEVARSTLSGLLIGWELAAAKPYWLGQEVALVGSPALSALYARALVAQGVQVSEADAQAATLAGLHRAWKTIGEMA
ncbi:2-dehydro-3-deoxygalactonokinase [Pseudorhodobacter wandonensis]|jgi:2-dehydro-3-deoxygalactonokinase|uniref:2-dehydro-3-deoxygalactonokinase n=1 Tax=Pseudorhodobacter wandonensis TaxID=1120568 RepID=UPI00067CDF7E|nr:2-dehydro-3-deoxygalactonokinase [Pseudorhodobacter wandonensis]